MKKYCIYLLLIMTSMYLSCSLFEDDKKSSDIPDLLNINTVASMNSILITWENPDNIEKYSIFLEVESYFDDPLSGLQVPPETIQINNDQTSYSYNFDITRIPGSLEIYLKDPEDNKSDGFHIYDLWEQYSIPLDMAEPNNVIDNSYLITDNTPYYLTLHSNTDRDYYSFDIIKDRIYSIGVLGGTKGSKSEMHFDLLPRDSTNFFYGGGWNTGGQCSSFYYTNNNATINLSVYSNTGQITDYVLFIQSSSIKEDSFEPNDSLSFSSFISLGSTNELSSHIQTDKDFFKFSGQAGKTYAIIKYVREDSDNPYVRTELGYNDGIKIYPSDMSAPYNSNFRSGYLWQCVDSGTYYIESLDTTIGTYNLSLKESFISNDSFEPDDTYTVASVLHRGTLQNHTLHSFSDIDWYKFNAISGVTYNFQLDGTNEIDGHSIYTHFNSTFYDQDGLSLIQNFDGYTSYNWTAPANGTYFISIRSYIAQEVTPYSIVFN